MHGNIPAPGPTDKTLGCGLRHSRFESWGADTSLDANQRGKLLETHLGLTGVTIALKARKGLHLWWIRVPQGPLGRDREEVIPKGS